MGGINRHLVFHIGLEVDRLGLPLPLNRHPDGGEGRVIHPDSHLLNRGHEIVFPVVIMPQHGGKQLYERFPPDGGIQIEPGAVLGDPHVDIAAKGRIPQVNRGRPLAGPGLGEPLQGVCCVLAAAVHIRVINVVPDCLFRLF